MKLLRHLLLLVVLATFSVSPAQARFHHPAQIRCVQVEPAPAEPAPIQPGPSQWLAALLHRIHEIIFGNHG